MSSCVYYKFKSKKDTLKISFDGPSISVKDLRERILLHSGLKANDMILKIERPRDSSGTEYKDDESVKKFSTVIVSRMPCPKKEVTRPKIANPEVMSRKDPYKAISKDDSRDLKFHEVQKNSKLYELDLSEEEKINLMMKQSTEGYFLDKNPRNRGQPPGPPPLTYVCHRCKMSGHYVHQCPGIKDKEGNPVDLKNLKRPTGIPQDFLVEVSKNTPGAYLTKDGRYTLPIKDRDAFAQGKKEKRPFSEEENPAYIPTERKPVDMIVCPLCQQVMREAVFISCCGYSYCQECLTDYIFNTDVKGCGRCPNCNSVVESSESFTENPTVREMVRKYNAGVTNLFTNTTKGAFQVKGESGTDTSATATASASTLVKPAPSSTSTNVPATTSTTTTTSVGSSTTTCLPSSQSPPIEDDSNVKPKESKETGAIRGPFVDGRRVLKPKPPPEVVLTRRSETLKTEVNPTAPAGNNEKQKTEVSQANDFELDLGLDDTTTDSFLNENIKSENSASTSMTAMATTTITTITTTTATTTPPTKTVTTTNEDTNDIKQEQPEERSPSREDPSGVADDESSSQLSGDKEAVSGETISVHTFESRFNRHERSSAGRSIPASKREPVPKAEMLHPKSTKATMPLASSTGGDSASVAANSNASSLPMAASVPSTHASLLRAPGMVITSFPHYRAVPSSAQASSQNLHPRSHAQPSVLVGQQFPQNHFFPMYNSACLYDVAQSQSTLGAGALINGVVQGPIPIPNPDVIDAPILSEDQFNILRRNFLEEEAKRHRRRHRSRGYSRSRSRDRYRYSLSRSPSSRRRRGGSRDRDRRSRSSRRWAPSYPEGRHRRSPHSRRYASPSASSRRYASPSSRRRDSPRSYHSRSRRESGSWRGSCSPVPYGGSVSSSHKVSPYRSDNRPRDRSRSGSCHRKRQRSVSEPRRSPTEMFEVRGSPDSRSHRRQASPLADKVLPRHRKLDPRKAYPEIWQHSRSPAGYSAEEVKKAPKPSKVRSCHSTASSHSTIPEVRSKKRKRRPSLDAFEGTSYPTLKQSRSQGSLPAYKAESMQLLKRERVRDEEDGSRHRLADENSRHSARGDEMNDRDKRALSPENNAWYSKTSSFLEKLGVAKPKASDETIEKVRSKPKKAYESPHKPTTESSESVQCVPLMDIIVENPDTKTEEAPAPVEQRKAVKPKKAKKEEKVKASSDVASSKTKGKSSARRPSVPEVDSEPAAQPSRKKERVPSSDDQTLVSQESKESKAKKKAKKEKREKKDKKKKKKKRKEEKEDFVIEAPTEIEVLPPTEAETDSRTSEPEHQAAALIPPPSKWELELDEHVNEFEEESRQESARSSTRIHSLVSSVNFRRVSVEEEVEIPKKSHKSKKDGKRHKKKKNRERH